MNPPIKLNTSSGRWAELWQVDSESRAGVVYIVGRTKTGDFGCSCPRWIYKREPCKHINHVQRSLAGKAPAPVIQAKAEAAPEQVRKALSRFALIE